MGVCGLHWIHSTKKVISVEICLRDTYAGGVYSVDGT